MQINRYYSAVLLCLCISFLLTACLGGDSSEEDTASVTTSSSDSTTATVSPFPLGIAVASPLSLSLNTSVSNQSVSKTKSLREFEGRSVTSEERSVTASGFPVSDYQSVVTELNDLLAGTATIADTFRPGRFYLRAADADCYGPEMVYQYHLDGSDIFTTETNSTLAMLPAGELGIWEATNGSGDEVCIAAQLNARAAGMKIRTQGALAGIASLIRQYQESNPTGVWPNDVEVGTSLDLTEQLNEQEIANVVISSAKITHSTANTWSYSLRLVYKTTFAIDITLTHSLFPSSDSSGTEATEDAFEGLLTYRVDDLNEDNLQCDSDDVSTNGSVHYIKNAATDIRLQVREAEYCDHGTDGFSDLVDSAVLTKRAVDPSLVWDNNFQILTAQYDPRDLTGSYSFGWQPSLDDTLARYINFTLASVGSSQAFFGYGNTMDTYDGLVKFFSCNISGPGAMVAELEFAQSQTFALNPAVGVYQPKGSSASEILYAPTNSCLYNGARTVGTSIALSNAGNGSQSILLNGTSTAGTYNEYYNPVDGSNIRIVVASAVLTAGEVGTTVEPQDVPVSDNRSGFTATRFLEIAITQTTDAATGVTTVKQTNTETTIYMPLEPLGTQNACDTWSVSLPVPKTILPESFNPDLNCTFRYDRDGDGRITDETPATVNVGASEVQQLGLHVLTDENATIEEQIIAEGFVVPEYPGEFK